MIESKIEEYSKKVATLVRLLFKLMDKSSFIPLNDFTQTLMTQIALYSPVEGGLDKTLEVIFGILNS